MQLGQEKFGMQTFNQALYSLYSQRLITPEIALSRSSNVDELKDMIERGNAAGGVGQQPLASHGLMRR
jgi:twitching motility protein PilT